MQPLVFNVILGADFAQSSNREKVDKYIAVCRRYYGTIHKRHLLEILLYGPPSLLLSPHFIIEAYILNLLWRNPLPPPQKRHL